jgi:hypothetical protein
VKGGLNGGFGADDWATAGKIDDPNLTPVDRQLAAFRAMSGSAATTFGMTALLPAAAAAGGYNFVISVLQDVAYATGAGNEQGPLGKLKETMAEKSLRDFMQSSYANVNEFRAKNADFIEATRRGELPEFYSKQLAGGDETSAKLAHNLYITHLEYMKENGLISQDAFNKMSETARNAYIAAEENKFQPLAEKKMTVKETQQAVADLEKSTGIHVKTSSKMTVKETQQAVADLEKSTGIHVKTSSRAARAALKASHSTQAESPDKKAENPPPAQSKPPARQTNKTSASVPPT